MFLTSSVPTVIMYKLHSRPPRLPLLRTSYNFPAVGISYPSQCRRRPLSFALAFVIYSAELHVTSSGISDICFSLLLRRPKHMRLFPVFDSDLHDLMHTLQVALDATSMLPQTFRTRYSITL